ncbi:conserved hypothetical protein [Vibrio aestuarianus]|nr:conserved hypothetical protein [Vibrio aestuarianus]
MATSNSSGYALELIVGVKDTFTQQSKKIENESKKLEREFKQLQKTTADVDAFKKAESAIEQLTEAEKQYTKILGQKRSELPRLKAELAKAAQQSRTMASEESKLQVVINKLRTDMAGLSEAGNDNTKAFKKKAGAVVEAERRLQEYQSKLQKATQNENRVRTSISATERELGDLAKAHQKNTNEIREHERLVARLGSSLKDAGLDVTDIIQEEKRLQDQLNKTNREISEQGRGLSKLQNFEKLGAIAGGAMASAGLAWAGNDKAKSERLLAARANYSLEEVQSTQQRQFRNDLIRLYGADTDTIFATQAMAKQQNLTEDETQKLTKAAIQLQQIFPDYSSQESVRALGNITKAFGVTIEEASNKVYAISKLVGDANVDLLDTFAEYSPLLGDKISFEQFAASIVKAREAGVWNTDKVGDSFKEAYTVRFTDESEFAKLVGEGDKAGVIDSIKNTELRDQLKEAAYRIRADVSNNVAPTNSFAAMMVLLEKAKETDAGAIKPILEGMGGTLLSEELGPKVLKGITEALRDPENVFNGVQTLEEASLSINTGVDKSINAFNSVTDTLSNRMGDIVGDLFGFGDALSSVTGTMNSGMNNNAGLGYAGLAGAVGGIAFGGLMLSRLRKKAFGKILGTTMGSQGSFKPASMFSGLFTKSAAEPVENVAKGPSFWTTAGQKALGGGKGVLKKLPVIGTALNAASIGMNAMNDDDEGVWRSIGSTVGGGLGGLVGALFGGAGALPGAIGGSIAGDEIAGWLYDAFNGGDDKINQQAVAQVEQTVQSASAQSRITTNQPPASIEVSFAPTIQIEAASAEPDVMAQTLVAALRDMTPQLKQALHDAMDDLWKDMDHVNLD